MTSIMMLTCEDCSRDIRPTQVGIDAHQFEDGVICDACLAKSPEYRNGNRVCDCPNSPCHSISLPNDLEEAERHIISRAEQVEAKMAEVCRTPVAAVANELWDLVRILQGELEEAYDWWGLLDEPDYARCQHLYARAGEVFEKAQSLGIAVPHSEATRDFHEGVLDNLAMRVGLHMSVTRYTGAESAEGRKSIYDSAEVTVRCCAYYWEVQGLSTEAAMEAAELEVQKILSGLDIT